MDDFMKVLLSLSVSGTLLFGFLCFCKRAYRRKFTKKFQYYIWLLAALRFLVPFAPEGTLTGELFGKVGLVWEEEAAKRAEPDWGQERNDLVKGKDIPEKESETDIKEKRTAVGLRNTGKEALLEGWMTGLSVVWATAAVLFFLEKIFIYRRFTRRLRAENKKIEKEELLEIFTECKERLRIKKPVGLYRNPLVHSPVMTGFFHPAVVIPDREISLEKMPYIFTHELVHYKRRDILYKWLIQIVICIHWFNPFVYSLGRKMNTDCELSCDEAAIGLFGEKAKKDYGDMLLSFIRTETVGKNFFATPMLTEGAKQIEERLGGIMDYQKKNKAMKFRMAVFAAAVFICFTVFGAYSVPVRAEGNRLFEILFEKMRALESLREQEKEIRELETQMEARKEQLELEVQMAERQEQLEQQYEREIRLAERQAKLEEINIRLKALEEEMRLQEELEEIKAQLEKLETELEQEKELEEIEKRLEEIETEMELQKELEETRTKLKET